MFIDYVFILKGIFLGIIMAALFNILLYFFKKAGVDFNIYVDEVVDKINKISYLKYVITFGLILLIIYGGINVYNTYRDPCYVGWPFREVSGCIVNATYQLNQNLTKLVLK
jgi:hypothetical protein